VPTVLAVTSSTKPKEIRAAIQHHYGQNIGYKAAHKVLGTLRHNNVEYEREEFKLLPAYLEVLKQADPSGRFVLQRNNGTDRFERLFISPTVCRTSFRSCMRLVACDGTFTKTKFRQTLLFAVTLDGNDEIIVLAWALVESENEQAWAFFFRELNRAIPEINRRDTTLISDRDKGIIAADSILADTRRAFCCQHIAENIKCRFGQEASQKFWKIAYARSEAAFTTAMQELELFKPQAARYVAELPRVQYATAFFPGRRYGHITSNIVEAANAIYLEERELPVLEMLNGIWHKEMDRRAKKLRNAMNGAQTRPLTPWGRARFEEGNFYARQNNVLMHSIPRGIGTVTQRDGSRFQVDLEERTCSCKRFQDTDIPCGHALTVIYACDRAPADYFPEYIKAQSWVATYSGANIPLVDMEHVKDVHQQGRVLVADEEESDSDDDLENCEPPQTRAPRGRPTKKRKRKGDVRRPQRQRMDGVPDIPDRAPPRCSTCKQVGHYARTCRRPHV
jgi:hypothetical protein